MSLYKQYLIEEIYGHQAIVYHRTGSQDEYRNILLQAIDEIEHYDSESDQDKMFRAFSVIQNIVTHGFVTSHSNAGKMYGDGVYCTYDFESQIREVGNKNNMEVNYGNIVIKSKLNLTNFLILDYQVARKVYGEKHTLRDQCEKLGLTKVLADLDKPNSPIAKELAEYADLEDALYSNSPGESVQYPTSDIALTLYHSYFLNMKVSGVIFTGSHDGHVAVVYNTKLLVPYSFCITDNEQIVLNWVPYNRYFNRRLVGSYVDALVDEFKSSRSTDTQHLDKYEKIQDNYLNSKSDGKLIKIKYRGKYGIVDNNGKVLIKPGYDELVVDGRINPDDRELRFRSRKKSDWGMIDVFGKVLIPINYSEIIPANYANDTYIVKLSNKYSLWRGTGERLVDFKYNSISTWNDYYIAQSDDSMDVLDAKGSIIKTFADVTRVNNKTPKSLNATLKSGEQIIISDELKSSKPFAEILEYDEMVFAKDKYKIVKEDTRGGTMSLVRTSDFKEIIPFGKYEWIQTLRTTNDTDKFFRLYRHHERVGDELVIVKKKFQDQWSEIINLTTGKKIFSVTDFKIVINPIRRMDDDKYQASALLVSTHKDSVHYDLAFDLQLNRILSDYSIFYQDRKNDHIFYAAKEFDSKEVTFFTANPDGTITQNNTVKR